MHELCDSRIYSAALGMPQRIAAISSPLPRNMQHRILPCNVAMYHATSHFTMLVYRHRVGA